MSHGLAIIGNCSYSALLKEGSVEWLCWPRPDSSFVFGPLLDREKGGAFTVEGVDATEVEQAYFENTNVLRTVFSGEGGAFELIDFAPRFQLYDRFFKPSMLIRILRPLDGEPRARVRCRPTYEYGLEDIGRWRASNHIEFTGFPTPVRLDDERPADVRRGRAAVPPRARPPPRHHLGRAARGGARGDRGALPRAHARLLAPLGEGHARAARLPARGRALGARAQAPPVRGHGRAPRRDDDEPPRAPGLRAHLGLPLLLAARRVLHAERARAARALGGDGALPRVPAQPVRGAGRRAPARVPDQRRLGGDRARARAPLRVQRGRAGAHREPGARARAERRLRRDGARR